MAELFALETKIVENRTKVELNSKFAQQIVQKEVDKCSHELDEMCRTAKDIVFKDSEQFTLQEYESLALKISLLLYDLETSVEYSSLRQDIAKMFEEERYSAILIQSKGSGTVAERQASAQSTVQVESVTTLISKHITSLLDKKRRSGYELLGVIKKIITSRISSQDFNN